MLCRVWMMSLVAALCAASLGCNGDDGDSDKEKTTAKDDDKSDDDRNDSADDEADAGGDASGDADDSSDDGANDGKAADEADAGTDDDGAAADDEQRNGGATSSDAGADGSKAAGADAATSSGDDSNAVSMDAGADDGSNDDEQASGELLTADWPFDPCAGTGGDQFAGTFSARLDGEELGPFSVWVVGVEATNVNIVACKGNFLSGQGQTIPDMQLRIEHHNLVLSDGVYDGPRVISTDEDSSMTLYYGHYVPEPDVELTSVMGEAEVTTWDFADQRFAGTAVATMSGGEILEVDWNIRPGTEDDEYSVMPIDEDQEDVADADGPQGDPDVVGEPTGPTYLIASGTIGGTEFKVECGTTNDSGGVMTPVCSNAAVGVSCSLPGMTGDVPGELIINVSGSQTASYVLMNSSQAGVSLKENSDNVVNNEITFDEYQRRTSGSGSFHGEWAADPDDESVWFGEVSGTFAVDCTQ